MNSTSISLLHGGHFDYFWPENSVYGIKDIALGLSHTARFSGQTDRAYTVAQHSVLVSRLVPHEHALAGLLHDAAEAFMCDIPSPLKALLPGYAELEKLAEQAIFKKFGIPFPMHPCIKQADIRLFVTERRDMQPEVEIEEVFKDVEPLAHNIYPWDSRTAYLNFMRRFEEIVK